jgi:hypothetical protein
LLPSTFSREALHTSNSMWKEAPLHSMLPSQNYHLSAHHAGSSYPVQNLLSCSLTSQIISPKTQDQQLSNVCSMSISSHHTRNQTYLTWKTSILGHVPSNHQPVDCCTSLLPPTKTTWPVQSAIPSNIPIPYKPTSLHLPPCRPSPSPSCRILIL